MEIMILVLGTAAVFLGAFGMYRVSADQPEGAIPSWYLALAAAGTAAVGCLCCFVYRNTSVSALKVCALLTLLFACAWTDIKKHLILNHVLLIALLVRCVFLGIEFFFYGPADFRHLLFSDGMAAGMLGLAALLCRLLSPGGVGFGDIKLLIVYGLYLGTVKSMEFTVYTFLLLFVVCLALLILKKATRKTMIPFAPFLLAGTILGCLMNGV